MSLLEEISEQYKEHVVRTHSRLGDDTVVICRDVLLKLVRALKEDHGFNFLMDLSVMDRMGQDPRFEVVYHLYAMDHKERLRIKVPVEENDAHLPSLIQDFLSADWLEREAWDMFGVTFDDHPDLRRLLMYEGFQGHPLRKDYPLEGPGEFLMENPQDWLRLRNLSDEAEIE